MERADLKDTLQMKIFIFFRVNKRKSLQVLHYIKWPIQYMLLPVVILTVPLFIILSNQN